MFPITCLENNYRRSSYLDLIYVLYTHIHISVNKNELSKCVHMHNFRTIALRVLFVFVNVRAKILLWIQKKSTYLQKKKRQYQV